MERSEYTARQRTVRFLCFFVATGFGSGYFVAFLRNMVSFTRLVKPSSEDWWAGTSGSLVAVILLALSGPWGNLAMANMVVGSFVLGVVVIPTAARLKNSWDDLNQRKSLGHDDTVRRFDHRIFVLDEWHGVWIPAWYVYARDMGWFGSHVLALFLAFALFRYFDGKKVLGIKQIEKWLDFVGLKRGPFWRAVAVMADDLVAGLYTLVVMIGVDLCVVHVVVPLVLG